MRGTGRIYLALIVGISLVLIWPGLHWAQVERSSSEERLKTLKKGALKVKEKIKKQEEEELSILSRLNTLNLELDKRRKELETYEFNLAQNQKRKESTKAQILKLEESIGNRFTRLKGRLRSMYKSGGIGLVRVIFSARSLGEILQAMTLMRYIVHYDVDLLNKLKQDREACLKKRTELEEYQKRVDLYKKRAIQEREALIEQQNKRKSLLESVRKDKAKQLSMLKDMEKRAQELRKILEKEPWSRTTANFETLKGKLIWPCDGNIFIPFGFQYDSVLQRKILNNGVGIKAPLGTDVVSVASGMVRYADWFSGYGKLIIIDHGYGYNSVYAHASKLFVNEGQAVKEGERVATVGDTDSIRGPELYFEIRFKGQPLDPVVWLSRKR